MAYSQEDIIRIKTLIIEQISNGESLSDVCRNNNPMPSRETIYQWLRDDKEFSDMYARSKEESAEVDADKVKDIADKTLTGEYDPAAARVAMDAYKWAAGKKKPRVYGNNVDVTTNGKDVALPTPFISEKDEKDYQDFLNSKYSSKDEK